MVNHPNRKKKTPATKPGKRHLRVHIPKTLPEGRVLVHSHVLPQYGLGMNGFRAWTQPLDDTLMVCPCKWAGRDLHGHTHYRMASVNPWAWEDEELAGAMRKALFARMRGDRSAKVMMEAAEAAAERWLESRRPSSVP
jgi:hypothetical protein